MRFHASAFTGKHRRLVFVKRSVSTKPRKRKRLCFDGAGAQPIFFYNQNYQFDGIICVQVQKARFYSFIEFLLCIPFECPVDDVRIKSDVTRVQLPEAIEMLAQDSDAELPAFALNPPKVAHSILADPSQHIMRLRTRATYVAEQIDDRSC